MNKRVLKKVIIGLVVLLLGISAVITVVSQSNRKSDEIKTYSAFMAVTGPVDNKETRLKQKIAKIVGAKAEVERRTF